MTSWLDWVKECEWESEIRRHAKTVLEQPSPPLAPSYTPRPPFVVSTNHDDCVLNFHELYICHRLTMSSIIYTASRNAFKRAVARPSTSALSATPRFYSSTMHDNDPEVLEQEKMRNLSKQQHKTSTPLEDAPGWNEHLASASEAAVKADQFAGSPKDLQDKTIKYVKDRHHSNESATTKEAPPHEPGISTSHMRHNGTSNAEEAPYQRDEIDGPLKNAHMATSK
ncbi:hypothetical protein PYCCODRAFT_1439975 [Trametes coccinea BRFM310]|uniref:Uncharacterized protein n=1 Tax=Trametes coccinea (strain BRFM310) TaxID=1353009 RepID=A0A1Y2I9A4_TRAC3|nr:hypothetical protein PYCCODRAFT_1439975 [Trametes coccinea BRFM310]